LRSSAAIILDVARRARDQGRRDLAHYLYQTVSARFHGTAAADSAAMEVAGLRQAASWQSGAATLGAYGALYGAWLGLAVPAAFGADESGPYGAGILAGVPIGFFAGRGLARASRLSAGQSRAIAFASLFGTFQAAGWRDVFNIGDRTQTLCPPPGFAGPCSTFTETSERAPFSAAIVGGLAGIGTAAVLARSREMSSGTVAAAQWGSLWGTWFGSAIAVLVDQDTEDAALTWALTGSTVGLLVTATQARKWSLSAGRPWLVSAAGIGGLVAGLGADLLFEVDDEKAAIALPLAGSVAGLIVGGRATRPRDGTPVEARLPASGALLELGRGGLAVGPPLPAPAVASRLRPNGRPAAGFGVQIPLISVNLP